MTKWKDLQDTNPEPNLLEAIAHAEKQPVKQYNHAYEVAFSLVSNDPEGKDVTPAMFRAALLRRIKQLDLEKDYGGWEAACGAPFDTYEEDTNP